MAMSVIIDFMRPLILSTLPDPEVRREQARQYLQKQEDKAAFYREWFRTTNVVKPEFRQATDISRYFAESNSERKYTPGRRHHNFVLDDNAPFQYNRRY